MENPQDWIKPEVVEKNALAFMVGAMAMFYFMMRMLKSGFFVLGDKAKLAAEAAALEAELNHVKAELAEKEKELAALKASKP